MAVPLATPAYLSNALGKIEAQPAAFEAPSLFLTLVNIALSLAFVVLIIYIITWLLKRWRAGQGVRESGDPQGLIQVLEKTWLDTKRGLAVVEMGDEIFLLGLGDDVSLISRVSDPAQVEKIKNAAPIRGGLLNFQEQFERVGMALRRDQFKRSKQELKANAAELDKTTERLKPPRK